MKWIFDLAEMQPADESGSDATERSAPESADLIKLRLEFESRLIAANLRVDAIRAGIIDLDGLKLIDSSSIRLGDDDRIIGGRKMMDDLKRNKPWLFAVTSSSSTSVAPASHPVRQKTAMEMTDEEYAAARTAVTKYQF